SHPYSIPPPPPSTLFPYTTLFRSASKIVAYAQGFQQMTAASKEYGWDLRLGEVATIWRGGCIIRARFLDRIVEAYKADSAIPNLDRKSTRLNSSHVKISYAVFCLK